MTADIYDFTGTTSLRIPPKKILRYTDDLKDVVVVGWDKDDNLYVAGSSSSLKDSIYMLELAKNHLLMCHTNQ